MATLSLRIDLDPKGRIGPGKIDLLEAIEGSGSIAAAGRTLGMSYRRAWLLVDEMNRLFDRPVVERQAGGRHGGGARLTPFGTSVVGRFRAMEAAATAAAESHLAALQDEVRRSPDQQG